MKPGKEPREWSICPICDRKYGFTNCRVSKYDKEGKRYEVCLTCGVEAEKSAQVS